MDLLMCMSSASMFFHIACSVQLKMIHWYWRRALFAANCTGSLSHPACETVWTSDVRHGLYVNLIEGRLSRDRLQSFCTLVLLYTPWAIKRDALFSVITLTFVRRLLYFYYWYKTEFILAHSGAYIALEGSYSIL